MISWTQNAVATTLCQCDCYFEWNLHFSEHSHSFSPHN